MIEYYPVTLQKMSIEKMVALYNLTSNTSKEELITVPIILKDVIITIKQFIFFIWTVKLHDRLIVLLATEA